MSKDPVRDAEFREDNYKRVEQDMRVALKRSGCILPDAVVEALTCTALEEALQTRRRVAYMVNAFTEQFGDDVNKQLLERLELVLLLHHRDADNLGYLPDPEDFV